MEIPIGLAAAHFKDMCNQPELRLIHAGKWGQGFVSVASQILPEFAFKDLRDHRVVAFSHPENIVSLKVMEKLGMQQECLLRETRLMNNAWNDEVVYSILDKQWKQAFFYKERIN